MSFGEAYGVLLKDLRLLARSVWVVDRDGRIVHKEIVPEVTEPPGLRPRAGGRPQGGG